MFLQALESKNRSHRPPVWLMRQAGRYMPSYRALRAKYSLYDLFFTPELATEITLMPIQEFGVDAAILFSDITVIALSLGYSLEFCEGPQIKGHLQPFSLEPLKPIQKAIQLLKPELKVPLIGFCGGPYTVASYINSDPSLFEPITEATVKYIQMQEEAGVDAIQIFDSWANQMSAKEFQAYSPYLKRLIDATKLPVILFMRGACQRVDELIKLNPSAISFDSEMPLSLLRKKVPMAMQGNLDPDLLLQPTAVIREKTLELLRSMRGDPGFIVNLGHGVKPNVSLDAVRCLVDTVQGWNFSEAGS